MCNRKRSRHLLPRQPPWLFPLPARRARRGTRPVGRLRPQGGGQVTPRRCLAKPAGCFLPSTSAPPEAGADPGCRDSPGPSALSAREATGAPSQGPLSSQKTPNEAPAPEGFLGVRSPDRAAWVVHGSFYDCETSRAIMMLIPKSKVL